MSGWLRVTVDSSGDALCGCYMFAVTYLRFVTASVTIPLMGFLILADYKAKW